MYIDPTTLDWIFFIGAAFVGGMIGYHYGNNAKEAVISDTIEWLCDKGYVRHFINDDDEIEILPLNEKK